MSSLRLVEGDALTQLQTLEPESVDCCITSPPYWALRDYKVQGQLGLESTFQEYINKLVSIFDEIKRVLKRTGSAWVVIGDTYSGMKVGNTNRSISGGIGGPNSYKSEVKVNRDRANTNSFTKPKTYVPDKSLCLIPERFAISMIDHGWILRNKIVWYKPNCMPSSAKDRFTVDWEYVYFFTKSQKYFFETQYEPIQESTVSRDKYSRVAAKLYNEKSLNNRNFSNLTDDWHTSVLGRIKRCVWRISTKPFSGAHFAVFPPDLVKPMIKAGCPEYICNRCGESRQTEYIKHRIPTRPGTNTKYGDDIIPAGIRNTTRNMPVIESTHLSDCDCNAGFHSGLVLDPFMGSGTVGLVAMQNARDFVGIELNADYIQLAKQRLDPYMQQERLVVAT